MILKRFLRTKLAVKDLTAVMKWLCWLHILLKRGICRVITELTFTFCVAGAGIMPKFWSTFIEKWEWVIKRKKGCRVQGYEPYSKNANYSYPVTIGIYQETTHRHGAKSFKLQQERRQHFQQLSIRAVEDASMEAGEFSMAAMGKENASEDIPLAHSISPLQPPLKTVPS